MYWCRARVEEGAEDENSGAEPAELWIRKMPNMHIVASEHVLTITK